MKTAPENNEHFFYELKDGRKGDEQMSTIFKWLLCKRPDGGGWQSTKAIVEYILFCFRAHRVWFSIHVSYTYGRALSSSDDDDLTELWGRQQQPPTKAQQQIQIKIIKYY